MAEPRQSAARGNSTPSESAPVVFKGRFDIETSPLGDGLSSPHARAYGARDRLNEEHAVFALVCDPELPPRVGVIERLKEIPSTHALRVVEGGVVPWPETGDHRFVVVMERPPGLRLAGDFSISLSRMPENEIVSRVIRPGLELLYDFKKLGITHRAIRPTNIFFGREPGSPMVVGECVSVPPAYDQPAVFEPVQSLQATPAGRGAGTQAEDIYALGVTVLSVFLGRDPAEGRETSQLLAERLERGTYATLAAQERLPAGLREALRGMLEDRPEMRWNVDDLYAWLKERRLKTVHNVHLDRAQRAFTFQGRSYYHPRQFANALAINWNDVKLEDRGQEIMSWVSRSIGDDIMSGNVLNAMEASNRDAPDGLASPAFVARLAMALDRRAPIRYRHMAAHIDGIGALLATHFSEPEIVNAVTEALKEDLPGFRYRSTADDELVRPVTTRALVRLADHLRSTYPGHGIERCLYELNPVQYCRSPLIADQKVMQVCDLLPALEKTSARKHSGPPFDRHIAAFIGAHLNIDLKMLFELAGNSRDPERAALGMLGVLAALQGQTESGPCPGVARWVGNYLEPVIDSFHHRMWREKVRAEIPGLIDRGDITALYMYLANGEARQRDRQGYAEAVAEYARLSTEIAFLKSYGFNDPARTKEYGHQIAAGLTGLIACATTVLSAALMV